MVFANSIYKRVITSSACVYVSDFKHNDVKIFPLKIELEYQNFIKTLQVNWQIKMRSGKTAFITSYIYALFFHVCTHEDILTSAR